MYLAVFYYPTVPLKKSNAKRPNWLRKVFRFASYWPRPASWNDSYIAWKTEGCKVIVQLLTNLWINLMLQTLFFRNTISRLFVIFLFMQLWKTAKIGRNAYHLATSIMFFLAVSTNCSHTWTRIQQTQVHWATIPTLETLATFVCQRLLGPRTTVERVENHD